jgi:tetratricopeptide (TPR) repeat protein
MVVTVANNGMLLGCNPTSTIRYENDSTIYETGHPCNIHWLNKDSHALTFVQENGQPLTEIWVRGGLPRNWQRVFNTDIETFRNGADCIREAVEAALADDLKKADQLITEAVNDKNVNIQVLCEGVTGIANHLYVNKRQFKDCKDFCLHQLQKINDYVAAGNEHNMISRLHVHLIDVFKSIATYRSGDKKKGKKLMEEKIAEVESEVERYRSLGSAETYINLLYYCNFMMYQLGYDILGSERTLLYLDFLTLMAPELTTKNKALLLNCRGNCYLLDGNKENARKMWQQIKELDADFFKKQPADVPLKKEFGE